MHLGHVLFGGRRERAECSLHTFSIEDCCLMLGNLASRSYFLPREICVLSVDQCMCM